MRNGLKRCLLPSLPLVGIGLVVWSLRQPAPSPVVSPDASTRVSPKFIFPSVLAGVSAGASFSPDLLHPLRLRNTPKPLAKLLRDDHAILLRNALIDSGAARGLDLPASWRSAGDPRAYIVQSAGQPDNAFRARLAAAGGAIVSYIPNNAYLVRMDAATAAGLSAADGVQAVLPYEPYYKVDEPLLQLASTGQPLPPGTNLKLVFFADAAQHGLE
jgi:hypothetical protein